MSITQYVTAVDIAKYFDQREITNPTPEQLANMANWFAEGAVTSLSNHIYDHLIEGDGDSLQYGTAGGCRCGGCGEWQIVDKDSKVLDSAEALIKWVKR